MTATRNWLGQVAISNFASRSESFGNQDDKLLLIAFKFMTGESEPAVAFNHLGECHKKLWLHRDINFSSPGKWISCDANHAVKFKVLYFAANKFYSLLIKIVEIKIPSLRLCFSFLKAWDHIQRSYCNFRIQLLKHSENLRFKPKERMMLRNKKVDTDQDLRLLWPLWVND